MGLTKTQKRKRALRRIAAEYGVPGMYFFNSFGWTGPASVTTCSYDINARDKMFLIKAPGTLRNLLEQLKTPRTRRSPNRMGTITSTYQIVFVDKNNTLKFDTLDDLKEYILIQRLAGI